MGEPVLGAALGALRSELERIGPMVVAFSGGVDSALVAWVATDTLGAEQVRCATAVSPSLAPDQLVDCRALALEWGLSYTEVETGELADPAYAANDGSRCYHCKTSLLDALTVLDGVRGEEGAGGRPPSVVLGVNLDDLDDHRPGQQAAIERGAYFPLVTAGFTKEDVRFCSKGLGLRTWDKPAAACLASRVPYGTPVTADTLRVVARAEAGLRALGFHHLRVRHYGDTARIEVPVEDMAGVVEQRNQVSRAVHGAGYRYVTLDLDGLRSGNLNDSLLGREPVSLSGRRR